LVSSIGRVSYVDRKREFVAVDRPFADSVTMQSGDHQMMTGGQTMVPSSSYHCGGIILFFCAHDPWPELELGGRRFAKRGELELVLVVRFHR
jgi:hypothetical protein